MKIRSPVRMSYLVAGVSLLGLGVAACNKQPNAPASGTPTAAPPIAALPMVAAAAPAIPPAPTGAALPPPPQRIGYAPAPPPRRYRYIDRAYAMGQAFADTPPDYAVDYQGTRPWIWRARNGAYRIVERLPRGERIYYYEPGQDMPFLVRDPDYSYAYDGGELAAVYGPNGEELPGPLAAQRADEASRYFWRSRELYRAAQYQNRQPAYAEEWARHRDQLRGEERMWQQDEARNPDWRAWHDQHAAEEQQQWSQERNQRAAYAAAIGLAGAALISNPVEVARRQASYFSNWQAARGRAPSSQSVASQGQTPAAPSRPGTSAPPAGVNGGVAVTQNTKVQQGPAPAAQASASQAAKAQLAAAKTQQREAAAAQAKAASAAQAQQAAAQAQQREAAAAQAKSAQAAKAQQAAAEAKSREAAAAQAKAAQAAKAQQAAAEAKSREAAAAQAKSAQEAKAQQAAAEAKRREAAAAQAKAAAAAKAQQAAAEAKQREAASAQAKAAAAAKAQQAAAEAKQREAAAAHAKAAETEHAQQAATEAKRHEAASAGAKAAAPGKAPPKGSKHGVPPKDHQTEQPQ